MKKPVRKPKRKPTDSAKLRSHKKILQVLCSHEQRLQKLERARPQIGFGVSAESTVEVPTMNLDELAEREFIG